MTEKTSKPAHRRTVLAGAGALGALGAAAALLPGKGPTPATAPQAVATAGDATDPAAPGYQLTEHVQHYYRTARI